MDADQAAHPGTSIRYLGTGLDSTFRFTYDANNKNVDQAQVQFNITSGPGTGLKIYQYDGTTGGTQYALNRINPARMIIGTSNIYESMDMGDTVANLGVTGSSVGDYFHNTPISYGGLNADGSSNPGSLYVGYGNAIEHRSADGSPLVTLPSYPGSRVEALVSDPKNVAHIFVLDNSNQVWGSFDEGKTWTNLTANLGSLSPSLNTLEIFSPSSSPLNTVLLVGGEDGVFQLRRPTAAGTSWTSVTSGLPKGVLVESLSYEYTQNVLTVGTLGRGVWSLTNFFRGGSGTGNPQVIVGQPGVTNPGGGTSTTTPPAQAPTATPAKPPSQSISNPGLASPLKGSPGLGLSRVATPIVQGTVGGLGSPAGASNVVIPLLTIDSSPVVAGPADLFAPRRARKLVNQTAVESSTSA